MLTEEVYTVLNKMDMLVNEVFYRVCQLRDLGELFIDSNRGVVDGSQAGCFITDYCVPAVADLESLQESCDVLKSFLASGAAVSLNNLCK